MPYVLQHKATSEIYACTLLNVYKIPYYGAKYWDTPEEAEAEAPRFLLEQGERPQEWDCREVEENKLKVLNVKLGNKPSRRLYLDEHGIATVREA